MNDLVKRLRSKGCTSIELEAADEIERLREALEEISRMPFDKVQPYVTIASQALKRASLEKDPT
ncbi:MAG TPA: hypothetical protein VN843_01910 [Anaerolineales bacterium]|nr:hypothetical protein [Anaerolineales bacterium]